MPLISRWSIRLGMFYLLLGLTAWAIYTANQTTSLIGGNWAVLRPVSIHLITVGWLTQLIFAVMYWMFPILSRQNPYGRPWLPWYACFCLNLGLIARAIFEIGLAKGLASEAGWGMVGAALLQWSGVSTWVIITWGRVRERGGR